MSLEATGTTVQPAWLELPEVELQKREYWTGCGTIKATKSKWWKLGDRPKPPTIALCFYSAEELAAYASRKREDGWKWDGQARSVSLKYLMHQARMDGFRAVAVLSYQSGEWVTVKEWPCDVPLLDGDK